MNPQRWQQVKEILHAATERTPQERAAFVETACADDADLRREVESLLEHESAIEDFIEESAFSIAGREVVETASAGQRIGHYRIVRELGRGGMGAVYLATRADDYEKQVAIKLVKRGMDTDFILRRFQTERQILANLEHPNIARLIDGGTTDDGLPFFVMEYVEGVAVDDYCQTKNLSETARLDLFRKICAAVSFAHQKLVVHRDLKPSNILVTSDGEPKLLDFGIAKLLDSTADRTKTEVRALTPAYASPEQLRGEIVGTSSDLYSLGVILRELLTKQSPTRLAESERWKTSGVETKSKRRTNPYAPLVTRDLRIIVAQATREDAARRYGSVEAFSEDLRRYLAGLPIAARKDSAAYRASKFIQRNRLAVAAALLIVFSLIGGLAATLWQWQIARQERARAERRAENLRKTSNSFVVELHDEIIKLPGSLPVRQLLLQRGIEQLDALAAESEGNAELQNELAQGYYNLGEMPDLNLAEIERNHQKGIAIYKSLLEREPENSQYRVRLAHGFSRLANVQKMRGDIAGALDYSGQASRSLEAVVADAPTTPKFQLDLFTSYYETAVLLDFTGDARAGLETGRRAFAIGENLARLDPNNKDYREAATNSRMTIAASLMSLGDYENALAHVSAARAEVAARYAEQPENVIHRYGMWATNRRLGVILAAAGEPAAALESLQTALQFIEKLAAESPHDDGYQRNTSFTHLTIGQTLIRADQPAKAVPHLLRALELSEKIIAEDAEHGETVVDLAAIHGSLGEALTLTNRRAEGSRHLRESLAFHEKADAANSANHVFRRDYAEALSQLGAALIKEGKADEALEYFQRASTLREKMSATATK